MWGGRLEISEWKGDGLIVRLARCVKLCLCWLTSIGALNAATTIEAAPLSAEQKQVDAAIVRALGFLSETQTPSGSWIADAYGESTATTSLAVMSFLAAGHVPGEGAYGAQLEKGIRWVVEHQQPNGMLVHKKSHGPLYSHGISTLMLAEVIGMVDPPLAKECRDALQKAVDLILKAQSVAKSDRHAGGWRYQPTSRDSDLSMTGWQLLALRAAKNVGCDVPAEHIDRAIEYVKKCHSPGDHGFAYQPGSGTTPTRTGTGILALEVCGQHRADEALSAADYLLDHPLEVSESYFFYGAYYCSVGMFKVGGKYWDAMRDHLNLLLLEKQNDDGSWLAAHGSEESSGKVYCTTMAVLALAVEYQFLPIYQR